MAGGDDGIAIPGRGPLSQGTIWARQVLREWLARITGAVATTSNRNLLLEVSTYALGVFMIVYPIVTFVNSYRNGVILLSIPLLLMFVGGLFGFAFAHGWASAKKPEDRSSLAANI
jgi:hypothetical protein